MHPFFTEISPRLARDCPEIFPWLCRDRPEIPPKFPRFEISFRLRLGQLTKLMGDANRHLPVQFRLARDWPEMAPRWRREMYPRPALSCIAVPRHFASSRDARVGHADAPPSPYTTPPPSIWCSRRRPRRPSRPAAPACACTWRSTSLAAPIYPPRYPHPPCPPTGITPPRLSNIPPTVSIPTAPARVSHPRQHTRARPARRARAWLPSVAAPIPQQCAYPQHPNSIKNVSTPAAFTPSGGALAPGARARLGFRRLRRQCPQSIQANSTPTVSTPTIFPTVFTPSSRSS